MPDLRQVVSIILAPAHAVARGVEDAVGSIRRQAPGARMVGEFVVKEGTKEAQRRLWGRPR